MSEQNHNSSIALPKVINSKVLYKDFVTLQMDQLHYPDGHEQDYFKLITKTDAAIILASNEEGAFLINREYRHPCEAILYSCPGGYLDKDEDPLTGARRELLEETGYTSDQFKLIGKAFPFAGITSQCIYYIRATNIRKISNPELEPSELLTSSFYSKNELMQIIKASNNIDGLLCTALLFDSLIEKC